MFKLTITEEKIEVREGRSGRTGRDYRIDEQPAFVTLPNGERRRIALQHEQGDKPFPAGEYEPKDSAGYVGKFGDLSVSTRARHWQPVAASVRKAA